jgi:NAD+ synthase (glutamine-hydrolysing)
MNPNKLCIVVAQLNFWVGAIEKNTHKIIKAIDDARQRHADLVVFPELALSGYPPEDLLLSVQFKQAIAQALKKIEKHVQGISVLLGYPHYTSDAIYNAACLISEQAIEVIYHKQYLPNQGVFDEKRYFTAGTEPCVFTLKEQSIGVLICEDLWHADPALAVKKAGAQMIVCLNASPFDTTKEELRKCIAQKRALETHCPVIYVQLVGGQDDLVFDGGSFAVEKSGQICLGADLFKEHLLMIESTCVDQSIYLSTDQMVQPSISVEEKIYRALRLGLQDYVIKNHFNTVLIGVSGGLDSALVLALAVDALGSDQVTAVFLPSRYTSQLSRTLFDELVRKLHVKHQIISIEPSFNVVLNSLGLDPDHPPEGRLTENIQARCRAVLLMALSNQTGALVLNTSNKSEIAVGYTTLYGDTIGGFSVLKDVTKTQIYRLAKYLNTTYETFSETLLLRPPSAELAHEQKDEDTLPPYSILDVILEMYLEQGKTEKQICMEGFDEQIVRRVISLIHQNEHKRRQTAMGPRVSTRAFHRERRYPISSGL